MANSTIWDLGAETAMTAAHRLAVQDTATGTTAQHATFALLGGLEINTTYNSAADHADIAAAVGQHYMVDISALASIMNLTLPATAAAGERVGVTITGSQNTTVGEELVIKANTGDTLNGVSAAEWSRIFTLNETVVMKCIAANTTWVVEVDGRIPQWGILNEADATTPTEQAVNTSSTWYLVTYTAGAGSGPMADDTNDRLNIRRDGIYTLTGGALIDDVDDNELFLTALGYDEATTFSTSTEIARSSNYGVANFNALASPISIHYNATVATTKDFATYVYHKETGNTPVLPNWSPRWITAVEVLL